MIIQFSQQDFAPRSFVAFNSPENTAEQNCDGGRLEIPENIAGGRVAADAVSPGLSLICSEMSFAKDTFFCEEYQDRDVLQIAFCLQGNCEWSYGNGARRISSRRLNAVCSAALCANATVFSRAGRIGL